MKLLSLIIILGTLVTSCISDSGADLPDPFPVSADQIDSIRFDNDMVHFTVISGVPTPCYGFHSYQIERNDPEIDITIYSRLTTLDPCIQVFWSITSEVPVPVSPGTTYQFRFWRYGGATLDTVITF